MNNTFIQFYSYYDQPYCADLCNGFSQTLDLCKSLGEVLWIKFDDEKFLECPVKQGTVYISAWYVEHLYRVYLWANENPDIKFIVGGPMANPNETKIIGDLPSNLTIINDSIEKIFNIPEFSTPWKLEIPDNIKGVINLSYTIDNLCYWGKCIFCSLNEESYRCLRERKVFNYEFQNITYNDKIIVRLGSSALTPFLLKKLMNELPTFKNLKTYRAFVRMSKGTVDAFKSIKTFPKIMFSTGFEFPNQRMWDFVKKGYNNKTTMSFLNVIKDKNLNLYGSLILGWNNLIKQDILDLENFMKEIPLGKGDSLKTHRLYATPNSTIFKNYEVARKDVLGPFYVGFYPKINKDQIKLNQEANEIFKHYCSEKNISFTDECDLISY